MAILFAFLTPIKSYATEQIPDYLIYNGKQYALEDVILLPYLEKANKWEWTGQKGGYGCTALARGYYAIFEIVNNELILKGIENCTKNLLKEFLSTFAAKDSIFKFDWFTDSIVIGKDEPLYGGIHEYYSILHFEKGKLIKETRMSYKEYLSNDLKKRLKLVPNDDKIDSLLRKLFEYEYQSKLDIIEHYLESRKKDKSEFLTKLKTRYEKRFGKPMSDFELKIQRIKFKNEFKDEYKFDIHRTLYGAREESESLNAATKLNIEDWLDIIRALYTCCLDKWEGVPEYNYSREKTLYIYSSKNLPYDERYEFSIKSGQLPNLKEFEKVMEDIIAKIRERSAKP